MTIGKGRGRAANIDLARVLSRSRAVAQAVSRSGRMARSTICSRSRARR